MADRTRSEELPPPVPLNPPPAASYARDEELLRPPPGVPRLTERTAGAYAARLLGPEDAAVARALYQESGLPALDETQWLWRFFGRNPRLPLIPGVFTADGKLVAIYPTTLRPVRVLGRDTLAAQACETLVHPEHRGGGRAYLLLMRFMFDCAWSMGVHFGFGGGATEEALKVGQKLSTYRSMYDLEVRERRLSTRLALSMRIGRPAATPLARLLDPLWVHPARRPQPPLEVLPLRCAAPELDELWQRKRDRYRVLVRRDARELDWRWFRNPVPSEVLAVRRDGLLEGYLVLRHHPDPGGPARLTTVLDLFAGQEPELETALLDAAAASAMERGSDFLHFAPPPGSLAFNLARLHPWRAARKGVDRAVLALCSHAPEAVGMKKTVDAALDGANWYYCQGDSDFFD